MIRYPIVWVLVTLALGIFAFEGIHVPVVYCAITLCLALGLLVLSLRRHQGVALASLFVVANVGATRAGLEPFAESLQPKCADGRWQGRVDAPVSRRWTATGPEQRTVFNQLEERCGDAWHPRPGRLALTLFDKPWVARGDRLQFRLRLNPRVQRNPTDVDPHTVARRQGVRGWGLATGGHVRVIRGEGPLAALERGRSYVSQRLHATLPPATAPLAQALALGDGGAVPRGLRDVWARAGLAHLLAVSGLHVGMVALLVFGGVRFLGARWPALVARVSARRLAASVTLVTVMLFCVWTGAAVPVVRATWMAAALLGAQILGRPHSALNALGVAGTALLLVDPLAVYDVGFVLSFSTVTVLLLLPRFELDPSARWYLRMGRAALMVVGTSVVLLAVTAPLTALYFGHVAWLSPISNLVAVPLATWGVTPLALAFSAAAAVGDTAAAGVAAVMAPLLSILNQSATFFADLSPRVVAPRPTATFAVIYGAALVVGLGGLARRRWSWAAWGGVAIVGCWMLLGRTPDTGALRVTLPYVGHGDAIVLVLPDGQGVVVDAGGTGRVDGWDPGRAVVAPLLQRLGIRRLALAVLTHPQADHIGGFNYLLDHFPTERLWFNGEIGNPLQDRLIARARERAVVVRNVAAATTELTLANVRFRVHHPRKEDFSSLTDANDRSVVLEVRYGERSILLTGDVEAPAESVLLERLEPVDVLKVPHHGSRTSSTAELLEVLQPRLALVSAGANHRFGLPHAQVVKRYERAGIPLLRTDRDGALTLHTDGTSWTYATFVSQRHGTVGARPKALSGAAIVPVP